MVTATLATAITSTTLLRKPGLGLDLSLRIVLELKTAHKYFSKFTGVN